MARMGRRPVIRFFLLMSASTKMVMMVMRRIPMLLLMLGMLVLLVLLVVKGTNLAFLELGVPKFQESVIWGEAAGWFWLNLLLSTAVRVRLPSDVPRWLLTSDSSLRDILQCAKTCWVSFRLQIVSITCNSEPAVDFWRMTLPVGNWFCPHVVDWAVDDLMEISL